MIPAIFGVSHGALQFMAYEELKKWRFKINPEKDRDRLVCVKKIFEVVWDEGNPD
jgi:hypothetical protein